MVEEALDEEGLPSSKVCLCSNLFSSLSLLHNQESITQATGDSSLVVDSYPQGREEPQNYKTPISFESVIYCLLVNC